MTAAAAGPAGARSARAAEGRPRPPLLFFLPSFPPRFLPSGSARPLPLTPPCGEWELPWALARWVPGLGRAASRALAGSGGAEGSAAAARVRALPGPSASRAGSGRTVPALSQALLLRLNCSSETAGTDPALGQCLSGFGWVRGPGNLPWSLKDRAVPPVCVSAH